MFLLDTNVLSEVLRPRPNFNVARLVHTTAPELRFASEITRYELRRGARLRDDARVGTGQHEDRAEDDFLAVFGGCAGAEFGPDHDLGDIGDADWHPAARRHDDLRQIGFVGGAAGNADQDLLARALDVAGARVGVV